jgi:hypothetical protein
LRKAGNRKTAGDRARLKAGSELRHGRLPARHPGNPHPPSTPIARTEPNITIPRIPMPTPDEPAGKTGKPSPFYKRHETDITQAEVVIIFLALIRTITSYYLLTRPGNILPAGQVDQIITGSRRLVVATLPAGPTCGRSLAELTLLTGTATG